MTLTNAEAVAQTLGWLARPWTLTAAANVRSEVLR